MLVVKATCPNCGAPLGLADRQAHVICRYCDLSLRIEAPEPGAPATETKLLPDEVPREQIDRVKQLVLDGKRDEAIQVYGRAAALSAAEAEKAVDALLLPTVRKLVRQVPINAFGFLLTFVVVGSCGGGAAYSARAALDESPAFWGLFAILAFGVVRQILWFVPKSVSTWVQAFGAEGRARVMKVTVLRPNLVKDGSVALLALEVQPARGGPAFVDEEVLIVRDTTLAKLEPGNVIRVRYDEPARKRVFPISPVEVVGRA